ncbi:MAG: lipopolysaccharide heptosyltransferase II [Candidatus Goldiibacteriota bacterium]
MRRTPKIKLTAAVVTYNESGNIEKCLKSAAFADEIVVVDSYSTDDTVKKVRKYTEKIYRKKFTGFSDIKNEAIKRSSGEWILSIDADEEISGELKRKILETINDKGPVCGYLIKRETFFLGKKIKYSGWGKDYQMRLFKRTKASFSGRVHEKVNIKGETGRIHEPFFHYSYPDSYSYFKKMNRYTTIQAEEKRKGFLLPRMLAAPGLKFFRMYFMKLGFLDGARGFILAVYSGFSEFIKFSKMREFKKKKNVKSVVVRAPNWIGDAVMSTLLIKPLKNRFEKVYVCADKTVSGVFEGNKSIDGLIVFDKKDKKSTQKCRGELRALKADAGINLSPSLSAGRLFKAAGIKIRAGYAKDGFFLTEKYKADKNHSSAHITEEYKDICRLIDGSPDFSGARQEIYPDPKIESRFLKKYGITKKQTTITIAPFVKYGPAKMWPLEKWAEVMDKLRKKHKGARFYIIGGAGDRDFEFPERNDIIDMRGKTGLSEVFALIKNSSLFMGNDSGMMHAADALGTPLAAVFASTSPEWTGPLSKNAAVVRPKVFCSPCFEKTCRYKNYKCLKEITPEDVVRAAVKVMA